MERRTRTMSPTRSTGYAVGARRTFPISMQEAWDLVVSPKGLRIWLGGAPRGPLRPGATYRLRNRAEGVVRVFKPYSHLRVTWRPADWAGDSLMQVRVIPAARGTTISFHQEHLPDTRWREERRRFFVDALGRLERLLRGS
jgi:uncharacterized protein YndB with AHSA1/START domain